MRESNIYHKFNGYYQKRTSSRVYEELKNPFQFNYYDDKLKSEIKNIFPSFEYKASSTYLVTQDKRASNIVEQDRIIIDEDLSNVVSIEKSEIARLGGNSRSNRKYTYLIEVS